MNAISYFSRQVILSRSGNKGQAAALFLVTAVLVLSLVFSAIYISHQGVLKIASANKIDSVALSAATWEARGLNLIAALNDGVYQCIRLIRWICAIWAVLAVAAATGYGAALFSAYSDYAEEIIRNLWNRATELAEWAEKVKEATPSLVLADAVSLSLKMNVVGMLTPGNPKGAHDGKNTLELHLKKGKPIGLSEALSPILDLLGSGIGDAVKAILNPILAGLLGASQEPIRLLVPEDDFDKRQFVRFSGYRDEDGLDLPFIGPAGRRRYPFSTYACPYGGGSTSMTWQSRLIDKGGNE
jgi:hypothetical protein